jgi:CheY-like chemotaxis protein
MSSILVVDDDPGIRTMLTLFLTHKGHSALEATNGQEALDQLRQSAQTPCLILLDLMMPVMNGWELSAALQRDETLAKVPIIVISAMGEAGAAGLHPAEFMSKPVDIDHLIDVVAEHCANPGGPRLSPSGSGRPSE